MIALHGRLKRQGVIKKCNVGNKNKFFLAQLHFFLYLCAFLYEI